MSGRLGNAGGDDGRTDPPEVPMLLATLMGCMAGFGAWLVEVLTGWPDAGWITWPVMAVAFVAMVMARRRRIGTDSAKEPRQRNRARRERGGRRTRQRGAADMTAAKETAVIHGDIKTRRVTIGGVNLSSVCSYNVVEHSRDGFSWGYGGAGPSQFALAILLEFVSEAEAVRNYRAFEWEVIAKAPEDEDLHIPVADVRAWCEARQLTFQARTST